MKMHRTMPEWKLMDCMRLLCAQPLDIMKIAKSSGVYFSNEQVAEVASGSLIELVGVAAEGSKPSGKEVESTPSVQEYKTVKPSLNKTDKSIEWWCWLSSKDWSLLNRLFWRATSACCSPATRSQLLPSACHYHEGGLNEVNGVALVRGGGLIAQVAQASDQTAFVSILLSNVHGVQY